MRCPVSAAAEAEAAVGVETADSAVEAAAEAAEATGAEKAVFEGVAAAGVAVEE